MKHTTLRRPLSLLLALALALSLVPAALAASVEKGDYYTCAACGNKYAEVTKILKAATCQEKGSVIYVCNNTSCDKNGENQIGETEIDYDNHEAVYADNGDGTHTVKCPYHPDEDLGTESHDFSESGICTKCMAVNYGGASLNVPSTKTVYVRLGHTGASISLGDVAATIGSADVTASYELVYSWRSGATQVSTESSYILPESVTDKEGVYYYTCTVLAFPSSGTPLTASCTVTVRVAELIEAEDYALSGGGSISLTDAEDRMERSVGEQIYDQVYSLSDTLPSHIVFDEIPSSKAGELDARAGRSYTLGNDGTDGSLKNVSFTPAEDASGEYTVNFIAYDTGGGSFYGVLTISVARSVSGMDVVYTAVSGVPTDLDAASFEDFWLDAYPGGVLTGIRFTELPASGVGAFYEGYISAAQPGTRAKIDLTYYAEPGSKESGIGDLAYVPAAGAEGFVEIPFTAYGLTGRDRSRELDGSLVIYVSAQATPDVTVTVSGSEAALSPAPFLTVYRSVVGEEDDGLYIRFLDVPEHGSLYVGRTGSLDGTLLVYSRLYRYSFYYNNSRTDEISDVTYVSGGSGSDAVRYVAYDARGRMQYVGRVVFAGSSSSVTVSYTVANDGELYLASADFEKVLPSAGTADALNFTQPSAGGTLYYESSTGSRTRLTAATSLYLFAGAPSVNALVFVPAAGFTGTVSIPFVCTAATGATVSGTVAVTVASSQSAAELTFSDVSSSDWFYSNLKDLVNWKVINGFENNTFRPDDPLSNGQALKMIMLAAGYSVQAPTGEHWASGYMDRALSDGLIDKAVDLDRNISRYDIAKIACKALRIQTTTLTASPFTDMTLQDEAAPYVLALYENGIVTGSNSASTGELVYYGNNAIRRSEIAAVIWRMYDYANASSSGGGTAASGGGTEASGSGTQTGASVTEESVRSTLTALRAQYQEGASWTDENSYTSSALGRRGYGSEAFALICSDRAFGSLPVSATHSDFNAIRAGDMVLVGGGTHTMVVLEKKTDSIIVAEGNYNSTIHWGREISRADLAVSGFTVTTRYPA